MGTPRHSKLGRIWGVDWKNQYPVTGGRCRREPEVVEDWIGSCTCCCSPVGKFSLRMIDKKIIGERNRVAHL